MNYPGGLDEAVARWLAAHGGSQRAASQKLQAAYRQGLASETEDLASYLTARLPATYAACQRVVAEVAERLPLFAPESILDCGAGPGTATWSAIDQWPSLSEVTQLEALPAFRALAETLNAESEIAALHRAHVMRGDIRSLPDVKADLVIASYVLAEVPDAAAAQVASDLWKRSSSVLILIEPGTPKGFARIHAARDALRAIGHIAAPCTHGLACPMADGNWCHFKTRLPRTRAHMHAKQAVVPYEDEAFSYLVVSRAPTAQQGARIIAPPQANKAGVAFRLCANGEAADQTIASRDKANCKRAKKKSWGDVWE